MEEISEKKIEKALRYKELLEKAEEAKRLNRGHVLPGFVRPMGIKEEIIEALEALDPQIDRGKALLELDESASAIARILKEPMGLSLVEYISKDLKYGKYPCVFG